MYPLRIKICGVTSPADVSICAAAGADAVGINFHPGSPRFVDPKASQPVDPEAPPSIPRGIGAIAFIRSVPDRSMSDGIVPAASLMLLPVDGDPRVLDAAARATPA